MRKSNSIFKTAFVSESGAELTNKDYFAYVEFDDYACYVLASGITDFETSEAAKEAVEHIILSFGEHPGISKGTMAQYMTQIESIRYHGGNRLRKISLCSGRQCTFENVQKRKIFYGVNRHVTCGRFNKKR